MTQCLRVLFLNVLVHAFFAIYSTLLTSTRLERPVSRLVALSIGLNVALNALLLARPEWWGGAVGAATNTLACATLVSGGYVWLVSRRAGVTVPWGQMVRLGLTFGLTLGAWWGLKISINNWLLETGLMTPIFGGILLLTGVVKLAELRALQSSLVGAASEESRSQ